METSVRKPVAPFYAVAVVWLVCGLLLPLYTPLHYVLVAAASVGVFFAVNALCRSGGAIGGTESAAKKEEAKPKEETTGDPEVDKMLKDGRLAIAEMKRLDDNIADPGISADIVRLEQVSQKIFDEVKRDPKKLPQIRKFMDYYLPTTLKLLNAYDRMGAQGVSGENIDATMQRVESMMGTIVTAFEKQLDMLFGSEAMDISTDITVLENMMKREGLSEDTGELHAESGTATASQDDIKLEL